MEVDAMGNPIVIGEYYGYSKSSNGHTSVVTGRAYKTAKGKVTLEDITEKSFLYVGEGVQKPHKTVKEDRRRNLGSVQVFHIPQSIIARQNAPKHDCMDPTNREADGMLYRCSICKEIL
jgi:hypothetical protein